MERKAQKTMSLDEVKQFYHNMSVVQTLEGFEVSDPRAELIHVLPEKFYTSVDGEPIDPKQMLTLPQKYSLELVFGCEFRTDPVYLKYSCGRYERSEDGCKRFYYADFAAKPNDPSMEAVLIRAHWNVNERVVDADWHQTMQEMFGPDLLYAHCDEYDDYGKVGDWYWVLKIDRSQSKRLAYVELLAILFSRTMNPVIDLVEEEAQKFERQKADYRSRILDVVKPLDGTDGWKIDDSNPDRTVVTRRINPGKQSPRVYKFRHDAIDWTKCAEMFNWKEKPEAAKKVD